MIIELHLIQNFAPSNLNRDDTNNPKDCEFGGVRRARISSQCLKRAIRHDPHFAAITNMPVSSRTKLIVPELVKALVDRGRPEAEARERAEAFARQYSSKKGNLEKDGRTVVMLFLSPVEIQEVAQGLIERWDAPDELKKLADEVAKNTKGRPGAPDIALFGRMLADRPETNLDAACQVAHAISTHRATIEYDFFTAVDDLQSGEETGAGMMGITGFNSACFYRYAAINFNLLVENLNGDIELARKTVEAFLTASTFAVPSGKQNSFAAQNPPAFLMAVVREDGLCWSLANAFEKPVAPTAGKSLLAASVEALDDYWGSLAGFYETKAVPVVAALDGADGLRNLNDARKLSMRAWVDGVMNELPRG
jgi:CRISPR system Cascade subunit CasC